MRFTVAPQLHTGLAADNRTSFLLAGAKVEANFGLADGSFRAVDGIRGGGPGGFVVELRDADLPAGVTVTQVDVTYSVPLTLGGRSFTALKIVQRLLVRPSADGQPPASTLTSGGWFDAQGRLRVANLLIHPLVDATRLGSAHVGVNTLILDITDGWAALHADNPFHKFYGVLTQGGELEMRVLAHTAGVPLIWYAVIPRHLVGATTVSPHIFLQPADNREGQNLPDDKAYLTKNGKYFEHDGRTLLKYIVPPVPDVDVERLRPEFESVPYWRNVLCVSRIAEGPRKGQITPMQWSIPAGLQGAFTRHSDATPNQFLLLPQRTGVPTSSASGWYGAAVTQHVLRTTDAILAYVQTNTTLTLHGGDTLIKRDKLVYSGYSESGFDLWNVGRALGDQLKALVAIEPQNLNKLQNDYRALTDGKRVGDAPAIGQGSHPESPQEGSAGLHHRPASSSLPPGGAKTQIAETVARGPGEALRVSAQPREQCVDRISNP